MQQLSEIQTKILKKEYPNLSLNSDIDIERYFALRNQGRHTEAIALYKTRLIKKYPETEKRTRLMRYYRSKNPNFYILLTENLIILSNTVIDRSKKIITLFSKNINTLDFTNAYAVIKHAESILLIISPNKFKALETIEKYTSIAKTIDFLSQEMEKTSELIRMYATDSLTVLHDFKKEHRKNLAKKKQEKKIFQIDLSKIRFSIKDIELITIPKHITRIEDKVIAFCLKYWNSYSNPALEKTILLYSKKYKTQHYEIFKAIKIGRTHSWKDVQILDAVLSRIVSGYYYSISGDLYLQKMWARHKPSLQQNKIDFKKVRKIDKPFVAEPATKQKSKFIKSKPTRSTAQKATKKRELPKVKAKSYIANSIADIIKRETGKSYALYKEFFFKEIRPSIRYMLTKNSKKKPVFFNSKQNLAEETIFSFLEKNYNNPYQNWETSQENKEVSLLGYKICNIKPIIEHWILHNSR